MKLKTIQDVSNLSDWEELRRFSSQIFSDLVDIINGKLSLTDNMDTQEVSVTFASAGVEVKVPHSLNRVPVRYIVTTNTTGVVPYTGVTPFSTTDVYLKATGAGVLTLLLE